MNKLFEINTDALARSQEGVLKNHSEREKEPLTLYKQGEKRVGVVYAKVFVKEGGLTIHFYGLQTQNEFRGLHLKVEIGSKESGLIKVKTNFDTNLTPGLLKHLWSGGPFSLLKAIVLVEETVSEQVKSTPWLRNYLINGGIGATPEQRMQYQILFEKYAKIF